MKRYQIEVNSSEGQITVSQHLKRIAILHYVYDFRKAPAADITSESTSTSAVQVHKYYKRYPYSEENEIDYDSKRVFNDPTTITLKPVGMSAIDLPPYVEGFADSATAKKYIWNEDGTLGVN